MSKRELKNYLKTLDKEHLEEQLLDLYARFKDVKVYYDFVFNPKEDKLLEEAKIKISQEYFPVGRRKAKARRSVAQKYIRHFITLGVDSAIIADTMFYNIEIAQTYAATKYNLKESFYKSMFKSFEQAIDFIVEEGLVMEFRNRAQNIVTECREQKWPFLELFINPIKNFKEN